MPMNFKLARCPPPVWAVTLSWLFSYKVSGLASFFFFPFPHTDIHVCLHVKCPLLFPNMNQNRNVMTSFSKFPFPPAVTNFMKIQSVIPELLRVGGQTDRQSNVCKSIFATEPKNNAVAPHP